MIQLDKASFPKRLEDVTSESLDVLLSDYDTLLKEQLFNPEYGEQKVTLRLIKNCLLLTYFLKSELTAFKSTLDDIRIDEPKLNEKNQMHFDLLFMLSKEDENQRKHILAKVEYGKLLRAYLQWQLFSPDLIAVRYENQILRVSNAEWLISPNDYYALLNYFVDWFYRLSFKAEFVKAIEASLPEIQERQGAFLRDRKIEWPILQAALQKTKVAVWDSGVDDQAVNNVNREFALNFDENHFLTTETMMPLVDVDDDGWYLYEGFLDLKQAIKSEACINLLEQTAKYQLKDIPRFRSVINQLIAYGHGTAVASIVSQDQPFIEIVPIRMSIEMHQNAATPYSKERFKNQLSMLQLCFETIRKGNIGIVNMSWNFVYEALKTSIIKANIYEKEEIDSVTKGLYLQIEEVLKKGMQSCAQTLFVCSAGNTNSVAEEEMKIPSFLNLSNQITVGAVDQQGRKTDFTTVGACVHLYANGSYVDVTYPNGKKGKSSGTSMAVPEVTNCAATMRALLPSLSPQELKQLLLENAEKMPEEGILILNPKATIRKTLQLVQNIT